MLQKYERKAEDILEKLSKEEPNERNFQMLSNALIIMASGKIMDAMGGEGGRYDGEREYYRGRRRDSMGRFRYDGEMSTGRYEGMRDMYDDPERRYWDDDMEDDEYYDGRGVSRRDGRRKGARGNIRGGIKD